MNKQIDELQEYADLDGTEWGEAMEALCNLACRGRGYLDEEFMSGVLEEIGKELTYVRDNAIIVDETETIIRTVKSLEWND
jgi:hypothetical protein